MRRTDEELRKPENWMKHLVYGSIVFAVLLVLWLGGFLPAIMRAIGN